MYVYVYMYIYSYTYIYIYISTYIYNIHTYAYVSMYVLHIYVYTFEYIRIYTYTYTHICTSQCSATAWDLQHARPWDHIFGREGCDSQVSDMRACHFLCLSVSSVPSISMFRFHTHVNLCLLSYSSIGISQGSKTRQYNRSDPRIEQK